MEDFAYIFPPFMSWNVWSRSTLTSIKVGQGQKLMAQLNLAEDSEKYMLVFAELMVGPN